MMMSPLYFSMNRACWNPHHPPTHPTHPPRPCCTAAASGHSMDVCLSWLEIQGHVCGCISLHLRESCASVCLYVLLCIYSLHAVMESLSQSTRHSVGWRHGRVRSQAAQEEYCGAWSCSHQKYFTHTLIYSTLIVFLELLYNHFWLFV